MLYSFFFVETTSPVAQGGLIVFRGTENDLEPLILPPPLLLTCVPRYPDNSLFSFGNKMLNC